VYQADRDFIVEGWNDPGTTTGAVAATYWSCGQACPSQAAIDTVFADVAAAGTVSNTSDTLINPDGTVFKNAVPTGAFTARGAISYTGPLAPTRKIMTFQNNVVGESNQTGYSSSPLERASLFGRAIYDLTDNVQAFVQANYSQVEVDSVGPWTLAIVASAASIPHGTGIYAPSVNAAGATLPQYLPGGALGLNCAPTGGCTNSQAFPVPAELATLLDSRIQVIAGVPTPAPNANFSLQRYLNFMPSRATNNQSNVYQLQTGFQGSLPNRDWTWEAYISHGETTIDSYLYEGWASDQRYKQVAQAPNFGRGFTQTSATGALGFNIRCTTGLPLVADFTPSADCIDAIDARMKQFTRLEQTIVEANMQGGIVEMRSGDLRFAAGVSSRENTALFEPDPLVDAQSTRDNPIGLFPQNETEGETDVVEIYGELLIPVLESLNLELGYRYSDYDREGGIDTYKALFDWAATDSFRVRGGRQIANRAPNVAELFTGPSQNVVAFQGADPCLANTLNTWGNHPSNPNRAQVQALCSAIINAPPGQPSLWDQAPNTYTGPFPFVFQLEVEERRGNPDVRSEQAETYTLGAVFQRESWSASIDFYTIDIKGAIAPPDAYFVYNRCFNGAGTNPSYSLDDPEGLCRLIVRDPISGYRVQVNTLYRNLGALETDGVDLQFNWNGDIGANGVFVNFLVSYVDSYKLQQQPGGDFVEYAGTLGAGGQFDFRTFTSFGYNFGDDVNLGLRWTHLPEVENAVFATNPNTTVLPTSSYDRFDLFGGWSVGDNVQVRFGIDNLLDADPEIVGANPGPGGTNAMGVTNTGFYDILGRRYYAGVKFSF
jgi:outer membrane receptor protein involved in Fe transport